MLHQLRVFTDDVARPHAGRARLGERAEQYTVFQPARADIRKPRSAEHQLAVRIVLDKYRVALVERRKHPLAASGGICQPRRVLEVGDGVNELDVVLERAAKPVDVHALVGQVDGIKLRHAHRKSLDRRKVRRVFHYHAVAPVEQDLGDKIERLLRTRRYNDLILGNIESVLGFVPLRYVPPELGQPRRQRVLKDLAPVVLDYALHRLRQRVLRKRYRIGQPARKRNDARVGGDLEYAAHERRGRRPYSFG